MTKFNPDSDFPSDYRESKEEMVKRRNSFLLSYLSKIHHDIKLIGNDETPAIIVDDSVCLSAYVHNFDLHFIEAPKSDIIIRSHKLRLNTYMSNDEFENILSKYEQRKVYKIRYGHTNLFLAGYNFLNKKSLSGKFPVFAEHNYKIYFNRGHALSIVSDFDNYPLFII